MPENFWNSTNGAAAFAKGKQARSFHAAFGLRTRYLNPKPTIELDERYLKFTDANALASEVTIASNVRYFVIVNGTFYFGDFIEALIVRHNWHVKKNDHLHLIIK